MSGGVGGGVGVLAVAFDPHPASVLAAERQPPRLCSRERKRALLLSAGADRVQMVEPTRELLSMEPREFVQRVVHEHAAVGFVEGDDFRFGKGRRGDVEMLEALGREMGFETHVVEPVRADLRSLENVVVSSSLIRWLVGLGRVRDAAVCLDRPFEMTAGVVRGERRGRTLGIPTANLDPADYADHALPADGVYAGSAAFLEMNGEPAEYPAAISIGTKPAFDGTGVTVEAHLPGYAPADPDALYERPLTLRFTRFLRDQWPYPGLEPLLSQIGRDLEGVGRACQAREAADEAASA